MHYEPQGDHKDSQGPIGSPNGGQEGTIGDKKGARRNQMRTIWSQNKIFESPWNSECNLWNSIKVGMDLGKIEIHKMKGDKIPNPNFEIRVKS